MRGIDRVVWRGHFIRTDRVLTGRVVYRNDAPFADQRDRIVRTQWMVLAIALLAILFFMLTILAMVAILVFILWLTLLFLDVIQLNMWRGKDRGVVVHENGVDMLDYRPLTVGRIFVPFSEISHTEVGLTRFIIVLRYSERKLFCHHRMVDAATIWHIDRSLTGRGFGGSAPELVIYGGGGSRNQLPQERV